MRRRLRSALMVLAVLVIVAALGAAGVYLGSERALAAPVAAAETFDAAGGSVERGRHLADGALGCQGCHGADLGGAAMIEDPPFATLWAPNLTGGAGGIGASYADADFERAIRRGVRPSGGAFVVMPSSSYAALSDQDVRDVVAYVRSVPPVERTSPPRALGPLARVAILLGRLHVESEPIASGIAPLATTPSGVTVDRGHYLAVVGGCEHCHGVDLGGGVSGAPNAPPAPALTTSVAAWPTGDFIATLREGQDPSGHFLDKSMPWRSIGGMTDDELTALDLYVKSLAAAHG